MAMVFRYILPNYFNFVGRDSGSLVETINEALQKVLDSSKRNLFHKT